MASDVDRLINALVGAAFGVRALDDRRTIWARAGYGAVGVDLLLAAYRGDPVFQPGGIGGEKVVQGQTIRTATGSATVPLKFEKVKLKTSDVSERVRYIHKQAVVGAHDPQVYALARAVVSRKCGGEWCIPERDHKGEVTALFNEVRARCRYTLDPLWYDAFQTPGKTLALRTGDCDDEVALLAAMIGTIGLQVKSRVYHTKGYSTWNHIGLAVRLPPSGEWMPLDPTVAHPAGWEVPQSVWTKAPRDFLITEKGLPRLAGE